MPTKYQRTIIEESLIDNRITFYGLSIYRDSGRAIEFCD
jgi:hypothetical protein